MTLQEYLLINVILIQVVTTHLPRLEDFSREEQKIVKALVLLFQ